MASGNQRTITTKVAVDANSVGTALRAAAARHKEYASEVGKIKSQYNPWMGPGQSHRGGGLSGNVGGSDFFTGKSDIKMVKSALKGFGAVALAHYVEESVKELNELFEAYREGTKSLQEVSSEGMRTIPVLGSFTKAIDEMYTAFANIADSAGAGSWLMGSRRKALHDIHAAKSQEKEADRVRNEMEQDMKDKAARKDRNMQFGESVADIFSEAASEGLRVQNERMKVWNDLQGVASSAMETYDLRINRLRFSLMAGAISQEAWNEAVTEANETYDRQSGLLEEVEEGHRAFKEELQRESGIVDRLMSKVTDAEDDMRALIEAAEAIDPMRFGGQDGKDSVLERAREDLADMVAQREGRGGDKENIGRGGMDLGRLFLGAGTYKEQMVHDKGVAEEIRGLRTDLGRSLGIQP